MQFKLLGSFLLAFSLASHSATISYQGYTLDTNTHIVSDGGIEWLQWSQTSNQTVNNALATYAASGWRLASNYEMAQLFNNFGLGSHAGVTFVDDESLYQSAFFPFDAAEEGITNQFLELFGLSFPQNVLQCNSLPGSCDQTFALFGSDNDGDGFINIAKVSDDWGGYSSSISLDPDNFYTLDNTSLSVGVALVRGSVVPIPAAAWLFASALSLVLFGKKYRHSGGTILNSR